MDRVPPELWRYIFKFVGSPEYLYEEPTFSPLPIERTPLKAASLVCRRWNFQARGILFRHIRLDFWTPASFSPFAPFTKIDERLLKLEEFFTDRNLTPQITSLTMCLKVHEYHFHWMRQQPQANVPPRSLWELIFSTLDPLRLTIIAKPTVLASFLSLTLHSTGQTEQVQILSLARAKYPKPERPSISVASPDLFTVRPWTSLLLNEGPFIDKPTQRHPGFSTLLRSSLFRHDGHQTPRRFPKTAVSFSYIAIYPPKGQMGNFMKHFPGINHLFVQLTPRPASEMSEHPTTLEKKINRAARRRTFKNYDELTQKLASQSGHGFPIYNYSRLRVVESDDVGLPCIRNKFSICYPVYGDQAVWMPEGQGVLVKHYRDDQCPDDDYAALPIVFSEA